MEKHELLMKSAESLLKSTQLIEELESIGAVNVTGSYSYNLMVEPDIDIEVCCTNPHESAVLFSGKQIASNSWNGVMFYDWVKWRKDSFPVGYYVGLKRNFEDYRWKIDIWFFEKGAQPRNADKIVATATPKQMALLLEAKEARLAENWPVDSTAIYKAVLEDNIETLEAVRNKLV
jgi:hypothetical protein